MNEKLNKKYLKELCLTKWYISENEKIIDFVVTCNVEKVYRCLLITYSKRSNCCYKYYFDIFKNSEKLSFKMSDYEIL